MSCSRIEEVCGLLARWVRRGRSVVLSDSTFTAVGYRDVARSPDGQSWQLLSDVAAGSLQDVAYGGGILVAVGNDGEILTSPDGDTWTTHPSGTDAHLTEVLWDGSRFVVFGGLWVGSGTVEGKVLFSPNGVDWEVVGLAVDKYVWKAIFTGAEYVVVAQDEILVSTDAVHWQTTHTMESEGYLAGIAWNGDVYVAVGGKDYGYPWSYDTEAVVLASSDARSWTWFRPFGGSLLAVKWDGDAFVAVGRGASILRATCVGLLAELAPRETTMAPGETRELRLTISHALGDEVRVDVVAANPEMVEVPGFVTIPAGSQQTTVPVSALSIGDRTVVSAFLPGTIGGGVAEAGVAVVHGSPIPMLSFSARLMLAAALGTLGTLVLWRRVG
jgi:hypothetical protein